MTHYDTYQYFDKINISWLTLLLAYMEVLAQIKILAIYFQMATDFGYLSELAVEESLLFIFI